jgi:parallel beta-helix repeat protein
VDYLNTHFAPNLTITVPDTGKYIYFEDSAVETALMNANVSTDGIGISVQDANRATLTSNTFAGNSTITSFNGFSYFTRANTNPPNNLF